MQLPPDDQEFLNSQGYDWELHPDNGQGAFLVVRKFDVRKGGFTPERTDLMIRIPAQYNLTPLDMWYCHPPIRIATTGQFAQASELIEQYMGCPWQRFSRHLPAGAWRPGVDGLRTFMLFIWRELQGYRC